MMKKKNIVIILFALSMLIASQLACVCDETANNLGCVTYQGTPVK